MLFTDIKSMDPHILLSIVNMKLRNESRDFNNFCLYYNLDSKEIENKLSSIDYYYEKDKNQFK